ncbi:DUF4132 domain-containing protein [Gimesia fumaroli]|uniref:Uncharacterized protein n=1 Tax=Gimesia fumaroli TaxID=2527976 RepID=A0A518IB51_9PLAN|nr:DUF4132 domain-containing protein [Gimesia fumaroli]QDV50324.1 hypothetical protein Enr17x_23620 [Gimesia fumaroli]
MEYSLRADELYRQLLDEAKDKDVYSFDDLASLPSVKSLLKAKKDLQKDFIFLAFGLRYHDRNSADWPESLQKLYESLPDQRPDNSKTPVHVAARLLRRSLPFTMQEYAWLADCCAQSRGLDEYNHPQIYAFVSHILSSLKKSGAEPDEQLNQALSGLSERLLKINTGAAFNLNKKFQILITDPGKFPLQPGEAWSDAALADSQQMNDSQRNAWGTLLAHCQTASAGKPSDKWLKTAESLLAKLGQESFIKSLLVWFPLVDQPRTKTLGRNNWSPDPNLMLIDIHADTLKGLVWCCSLVEDPRLARAIAALAISTYKKVPGVGARAVKVGNACVWSLGQIPSDVALSQLAFLKVKVKFGTAQIGIEKALNATAERMKVPRDEIEEMGVPAYGLTDIGQLEEPLGEFTAQLNITGTTTTQLVWIKPDGKTQKSVPAAVKKEFPEELKELKASAKDIQKMLPAQRERIDNLFLEQKEWPFKTWKERYLDHPLVGTLARRIIWQFKTDDEVVAGIWRDDKIVDQESNPLEHLNENTIVELWHPIGKRTETILAWREWLEQHEIQQPFKQAHREVYLLTDAERNTNVYSNRYAAHIIKQHQFNALCAARGWKNQLRLMVDDAYFPAMKLLPKWDLRVEFWVEGVGDNYGVDTNETGTYLYLATDQVRFYPLTAAQRTAHASGGGYDTWGIEGSDTPIELTEIPPLVLSELMWDVDLFVGVSSVANDPTWSDGGPEGRYIDYWHRYSFGDLTESANTRKEILERLVPRLKIAKQCSFEDKYLVVEGSLRTYKIHLGSSNILMSPNDAYLCIVRKQSIANKSSESLFLPFEGDNMLSIILSKAFLLADDTKISDPTIVSQIKAGR